MLGNLLHTLQATDPKTAILPWYIRDRSSLPPLLEYSSLSLLEPSVFRTKYASCFNPKFNQANWCSIGFAHTGPQQHLLSNHNSNNVSWYRDNDWKAILSMVQGSDSCIPLGKFLYSGPFMNTTCLTEQIQLMCATNNKTPICFGCCVSKNLDIKLGNVPYCNWMLAENRLIKVKVSKKDVK